MKKYALIARVNFSGNIEYIVRKSSSWVSNPEGTVTETSDDRDELERYAEQRNEAITEDVADMAGDYDFGDTLSDWGSY